MKIEKHYTLHSETPHAYVIHDARDGKTFPVAKHALNLEMHGKLAGIKKFANGGEIKAPDALLTSNDAPPNLDQLTAVPQADSGTVLPEEQKGQTAFEKNMYDLKKGMAGLPEFGANAAPQVPDQGMQAPQADIGPASDSAPITTSAIQPAAQVNPLINQSGGGMYNQFQSGFNQQMNAIQGEGAVGAAQATEEKDAYEKYNKDAEAVAYDAQAKRNNLDLDNEELTQLAASQKLDPRRYVQNMSTGNKIMAGIAIALGGMGAGMAGQDNVALKQFNKNIDTDIEDQKMNMAKTDNALKRNMEKYGDLRLATQATYMQMNAALQGQLHATASKYATPMAALRANQLAGQLQQEYAVRAEAFQKEVFSNDLGRKLQSGQIDVSKVNPLALVSSMVPKDQQAAVSKEIGGAIAAAKVEKDMMTLFDKAGKENTVLKTGAGMLREPASILALKNLSNILIHELEGRITETEKHDFNANLPQPGDTDSKIREKRKWLISFLEQKKQSPLAEVHHIPIGKMLEQFSGPKFQPGQIVRDATGTYKINPDGKTKTRVS